MKPIKEALRVIGHKGKLTSYGFTIDEITEIIEEDENFQRLSDNIEPTQTTTKERIKMMIDDKVISKEMAWQKRCNFLKAEYEQASREYFEEKFRGNNDKDLLAKKNRKKFDYETETYRPDYDTRHFTETEVQRADSVDIDKFIKLDYRGFVKCPFHNEKTPSMHITKNKFYCFGCGEKGKTISFVMKHQNKTFQEAVGLLLNYF